MNSDKKDTIMTTYVRDDSVNEVKRRRMETIKLAIIAMAKMEPTP
jgi:hypothetical protein